MSDPICDRIIEMQGDEGTRELTILMYKPSPDPRDGGDWKCSFEIRGLAEPLERTAYGIDSLQALLHCIKMIDVHLRQIQREQNVALSWLGLQDLGFHMNVMDARS